MLVGLAEDRARHESMETAVETAEERATPRQRDGGLGSTTAPAEVVALEARAEVVMAP